MSKALEVTLQPDESDPVGVEDLTMAHGAPLMVVRFGDFAAQVKLLGTPEVVESLLRSALDQIEDLRTPKAAA